ncbi:hypothetical protein VTN77DRAFT_1388 [Rasamsonia byssochlamydoides]|uniref:uncharacterized protein n=1 Tax=Rasamsonia byssochlamydoides TaxID=89139 RepID=UPI00374482C7
MLSPAFAEVVRMFTSRTPIALNYTQCEGTCHGTLIAPGFDINCTYDSLPYNLTDNPGQTYWIGDAFIATAKYPVGITNGTVALASQSVFENNTLELQYPPPESPGNGIVTSLISGIQLAAQTLYGSNFFYTTSNYAIQSEAGPVAINYLNSSFSDLGQVTMTWADPAPDIFIGDPRVDLSHCHHQYEWQLQHCSPVYGWWHLGRPVSFSPVEIANAFAAPLFRGRDSNADVDGLLKTFGSQRVRYGAVAVRRSEVSEDPQDPGLRLEIAEQDSVSWPLKGVAYNG